MTIRFLLRWVPVVVIGLSLPLLSLSQQTVLPPDQPEQDACHALSLCGGKFSTPYSYQGTGLVLDLNETPCDMVSGGGEGNSMWMKVTIAGSGLLAFNIIPVDTMDDYDFAVLNVTNVSCGNLSTSDVVRCNFNNNESGSNAMGIVGLSASSTIDDVEAGAYGSSFVAAINASPGQTYLIMINNFGHDNNPGPSSGFTIDFSPSTASFVGNQPPALDSIVRKCSDSTVTVQLTTPILCSSIAADGSDFYTTPAAPILSASGVNCTAGNSGYTLQVTIVFAGTVPTGNYVLNGQVGTDGNTLLGLCGDSMVLPAAMSFFIPSQVQDNFLLPDSTVKCSYTTLSLGADRPFSEYLWSSGQTTPTIGVINPGVYTLVVTDSNGCVGTDSTTIIDSTCPQYVYLPSAFTPNGDGHNDVFKATFAGPTNEFRLAVYDRWGRQAFESSNPSEGWDGTTGGRQQPAGTYVWVCVYTLYQQPQRMQKGTVILVR